jgi:hypothetical protein
MSGEIRNSELFVAQRRHDHQIDLLEDTRHFKRHLAPQTIGLHEVNRGKEACLAEQVWPRVLYLHLELAKLIIERQFFERCGALSK